ncbi:4Fe-4S dicluster domain-containing protein [Chishuiella changwenlii]|uniref:4Fe-4S dicluster domain-containing protein n=2 Tax=Chishuiella changwenlii TaxID=1434701 RepID=A0A1M7CNQ2_9FLAO|nr:4Fe-4S dicluster domain-containing protein [Chishuiella changwenlii]
MINYIPNVIFLLIMIGSIWFFTLNVKRLIRNIKLGKDINRFDRPAERWKTMARVALGQGKMTVRPIPGILHIFVYVGFVLINIEVLEIIIDGIFGTHRILSFLGSFYNGMIGFFEILAFLVMTSCIVFWIRRNIVKIKRFWNPEMKNWPKDDANYILFMEVAFMLALFTMNGADQVLQEMNAPHYSQAGSFPISSWLTAPIIRQFNDITFITIIERAAWWFHIIGIFFFLNYLYYSKHLHIILAFPNTWFSKLEPKGEFNNLEAVTNEVKMMMDPNADPYAAPAEPQGEPETFGAKDVFDLNQVQLLNAYTCTECGRCTSECPANLTGKKLSPRKIMMDTRDRLEDISKNIDTNGKFVDDGKTLVNDYITAEELWACTSCNACVQACPVNIDPLSIIVDLRRFLVMEQSAAPQELNMMMTNVENNGAPWQFNNADRLNWAND